VLQIGPAERKEKMLVSRTETSDRRAHRLAKCTYRSASTFSKAPSLRFTIFAVFEMRRGVVGRRCIWRGRSTPGPKLFFSVSISDGKSQYQIKSGQGTTLHKLNIVTLILTLNLLNYRQSTLIQIEVKKFFFLRKLVITTKGLHDRISTTEERHPISFPF
jgi:hypothetical protein